MARIFDNIDNDLLTTLRATLQVSHRSDFCVGYLNLRGWQAIDDLVAPWNPEIGQVCRVLVGMQRPHYEDIRELYRQTDDNGLIDNATASRLKTQFAAHLREQITLGIPSGQDEAACAALPANFAPGRWWSSCFYPTRCTPSCTCCFATMSITRSPDLWVAATSRCLAYRETAS